CDNLKSTEEVPAGDCMPFEIVWFLSGQFHKPAILCFNLQNNLVQYNKILLCNAVLSAGFKLAILFRDAWYALRICQRSSHTDIRMLTEADRQPRKQAYAMRG